ncbi:MAG TPA: ATP-binding cassette domain-containing protein [Solirubrobacterales bacterium]|nr:ATP-binding cassette domain-containing protein [Solirubrobacterales bacterium]
MSDGLALEAALPLRDCTLEVSLEIAPGERLALMGRSGAGKTSLLRIAAGLLDPRSGRVSLGGETWLDTAAGIDLPPERRRCGLLFQEYALFPCMNAWRNVAYSLRRPRGERRRRALELLGRFGVGHVAEAAPAALSGGERQRVALARALAAEPRALLLDEPLAALDPATRSSARRELDALLAAMEIPVAIVTHSPEDAARLADRTAVIERGRVAAPG